MPKQNKPVKPVKKHWKSGIQSKFLDAALQKKCKTQAELAYTNDWWKYKKLEMSKKEIVVSQLCRQGIMLVSVWPITIPRLTPRPLNFLFESYDPGQFFRQKPISKDNSLKKILFFPKILL